MNVSTLVFEEPRRDRRLIVHLARDISHRKKSEELLAKMLEISKEMVAVADHPSRHSPNKSSESFAYSRKPKTFPRSPATWVSHCPRCEIICTAPTRNSVPTIAWKP